MENLLASVLTDNVSVHARLEFSKELTEQDRVFLSELFKTPIDNDSEQSFWVSDNSHFISFEDLKAVIKQIPSFSRLNVNAERTGAFAIDTSYVSLFDLVVTKDAVINASL